MQLFEHVRADPFLGEWGFPYSDDAIHAMDVNTATNGQLQQSNNKHCSLSCMSGNTRKCVKLQDNCSVCALCRGRTLISLQSINIVCRKILFCLCL